MRNGLVEGVSLRAVLRESGAMAPEAAASVLAGMLVTLAVVHGDVRPEHVEVDGSGGIALTGFGGEQARFTPNAPTYLAPERLTGGPASAVADVFSATAIFFECLTNESPFVAATPEDLAALHEYAEVIAEFAPQEMRLVAQHGLAPQPARRPATPHAFLDEVTATATEVCGPDWQARGRALLSGWAAAAARAAGAELAAAPGRVEAPPVGEPIDEALLGLGDGGADAGADDGDAAVVGEAIDEAEEMPPPMGEPIDEALLGMDDEVGGEEVAAAEEAPAVEEAAVEAAAAVEEAAAEDDKDYDWFNGSGKAEPVGAEADVLAAFDGARAGRTVEAEADPYTPSGFDVFADRPGGSAADAEDEPLTGHWDEPVAETEEVAPEVDAVASSVEEEAEADGEAGEPDTDSEADEPEAAEDEDGEFESLIEDSELLSAFDAFTPASAAEPEPEPDLETTTALETEEPDAAETESEPEPLSEELPEPDSEATTALETETGEPEPEAEATTALETEATEPESEAAAAFEAEAAEPEPEAEATAALEAEAAEPESESASAEPEPEPEPEADPISGADLEDDWVIPAKPSPKVPRSLSAFAVSLPSLPRPQEAEEPKPVVQTSAPDDWFRPGVAEPVGVDAHHTQVLNPDRDNTIESEATRTLDEVPAELAVGAGAAGVEGASARSADDDDDDFDGPVGAGGPGGPRRRTLVGAVTTAVLLVAGAATAVMLGGSGKAPAGTGATPSGTASASTPSATAGPTTPTGTSTDSGSETTSLPGTPSSRHSSTHSRSRSSSPTTTTHSSSDATTSSSPSDSATSATSSSENPTNSGSSPSSTCTPDILGFCHPPTPTSTPNGGSTKTPGT